MTVFDLESVYLSLNAQGVARDLSGEDFMARLVKSPPDMAYLLGVYPMTADWTNWEMHPKGHEVLVMLEGRIEMTFDHDGVHTAHLLEPGGTLVVPPGVWHRARVLEPGRLLGVTYGEGTQHRPHEGASS